jgi:hypothetical protein
MSALADIFQIFESAYVEIYYGIFLHKHGTQPQHTHNNQNEKKKPLPPYPPAALALSLHG